MKGIIYCIRSLNNNLIYIGSSKQSMASRRAKHIYDSKHSKRCKPVHKTILENGGFDKFHIQVLKEVEVENLQLLHLYEKKIIEDYKNNSNYKLMNSCI